MRGALKAFIATASVMVALAPAVAHAEGYISPWASTQAGSNFNNGRAGFGFDAGGMGAGVIGGELDFGYSPSFFGTDNDFGHNTVINLMPNLIVGVPIGGTHGAGIRPFVTAGAGLLRTQIDGGTLANVSSSNNQWGWDAGAGVMGYFNDHFGLRGDLKYIRGFENLNTGNTIIDLNGNNQLHFWRADIGVVIR
jgi:outer membrane protein with beta-barrel domain